MSERVVVPEILDSIPAGDPRAQRSRRDLAWINLLMGNENWILRSVNRFADRGCAGITELGAGDGRLLARLARTYPDIRVLGLDLMPKPPGLPGNVTWLQGDVFGQALEPAGGILVVNLFLHHFEAEPLARLGEICGRFDGLILNEPDRAGLPHFLGRLLHPIINEVTRHDMHVSIRAGFRAGELPSLLQLAGRNFLFRETSTWRGSRRVVAWRS